MAIIYQLGDGSKLCDKHLCEQYPDMAEPEIGWKAGKCDICSASRAARALRAIPSERRSEQSRINGLKGGKPKHLRGGRPKGS